LNDIKPYIAFKVGNNREKSNLASEAGVKPKWEGNIIMIRRHWLNNEIRINVH